MCSGSYYCSAWFRSETQPHSPHSDYSPCKWEPYHCGISCAEVGLVFSVGAVLRGLNNYIFSMWKGVKALFLLKHSAQLSALIVLASWRNWEAGIKSQRFVVSVFSWMSTTGVAIPALMRGAERELEAGISHPRGVCKQCSGLTWLTLFVCVFRKICEMGSTKNFHNTRGFSPLSLWPLHVTHHLIWQ